MALTDFLTQIANSIRNKDGTTEPILASEFPQRILNISSGGVELPVLVKTGTFTVSQDSTEALVVPHGLTNFSTIACVIFPDNIEYAVGHIPYSILGGFDVSQEKIVTNNGSALVSKYGIVSIAVDSENITLTPSGTTYKIIAGIVYRWFILGGGGETV